MITYEKIDATRAKKIVTTESEIVVADLEAEIAGIKNQIAEFPQAKTKADQETLDYWNTVAVDHIERDRLEGQLAVKEAELVKIKTVMGAKMAQGMRL